MALFRPDKASEQARKRQRFNRLNIGGAVRERRIKHGVNRAWLHGEKRYESGGPGIIRAGLPPRRGRILARLGNRTLRNSCYEPMPWLLPVPALTSLPDLTAFPTGVLQRKSQPFKTGPIPTGGGRVAGGTGFCCWTKQPVNRAPQPKLPATRLLLLRPFKRSGRDEPGHPCGRRRFCFNHFAYQFVPRGREQFNAVR
jgi:hypothetical protein